MHIFFLVILTIVSSHVFAEEKKLKITWTIQHAPPYYILEGDLKGSGVGDQLLKMLQSNLPEYEHDSVVVAGFRYDEIIDKPDQATCSFMNGLNKLDDLVSYPSLFMKINSGIYFKKHNPLKQFKDYDLSLADLIKKPFVGGMTQISLARLDLTKEKLPSYINLLAHQASSHMMLFSDRVEYIFSSFEEMTFYQKLLKKKIDYEYILLKSGSDQKFNILKLSALSYKEFFSNKRNLIFGFSHVKCSDHVKRNEIIARINEILMKIRPTKAYKDIVLQWMPDEMKSIIDEVYNEFAISKAKQGFNLTFEEFKKLNAH